MRPWLEKRRVRVIAEITPGSWRVLREKDRAFAELFQVIPVNEPPEHETLRILINVARQLEEAHRCNFSLDVVPAAYELQRRYGGDAAFPGKAARFLKRLAVRFAGGEVNHWQVLNEFHQQSGLQIALLDKAMLMERSAIIGILRQSLAGQDHALNAFADVLLTLKARLNDPHRPLAVLLLLGPTGVGKTQAARALATYLFGSSERLLRFDMNEYVEAGSALRLTGSPRDPEGLLTSAVRRQPFSVVLFDEIEKGAPEVFDLLLGALDEGRLTDSLGRVTDFTQTVILLTSNLGAREARARLGFGAFEDGSEEAIYISAAEKFFRPEFFNRLDRVIPFRSLDRAELEKITRQLINNLLARDGLQRRDGLLNVTPEALKRLAELGHHPQLGARVETGRRAGSGATFGGAARLPSAGNTHDCQSRDPGRHVPCFSPGPRARAARGILAGDPGQKPPGGGTARLDGTSPRRSVRSAGAHRRKNGKGCAGGKDRTRRHPARTGALFLLSRAIQKGGTPHPGRRARARGAAPASQRRQASSAETDKNHRAPVYIRQSTV
jgi:ATP-dependent Clp protease ATP-binding subunit ClpA